MAWIVYAVVVLVISGIVGMHLGRFREAYTEMTGMMAGMTMGMLNGFLLGFATAAAANSMFWGNLFGVLLGLTLGAYFGRAGSLMGVMDGAMGGVMGGSMGAMLAVMLVFPSWALMWTSVLLALLYIAGMCGLVVLIERSAPQHAALHRLAPYFTRAMRVEAAEEAAEAVAVARRGKAVNGNAKPRQIVDYYAFLGVAPNATEDEIADAYLETTDVADEAVLQRAERALAILTDPGKREAYNRRLIESRPASAIAGRGDCYPPPKQKKAVAATAIGAAGANVAKGREVSVEVNSQSNRSPNGKQTVAGKSSGRAKNGASKGPRKNGQHTERRNAPQAQERRNPPISGTGIIVAILLMGGLMGWWLISQNGSRGSGASGTAGNLSGLPVDVAARLDTKAVVVPLAYNGTQTLDLVVNGDTRGYQPSIIKVKQGVPVHFNLSVQGADPG